MNNRNIINDIYKRTHPINISTRRFTLQRREGEGGEGGEGEGFIRLSTYQYYGYTPAGFSAGFVTNDALIGASVQMDISIFGG